MESSWGQRHVRRLLRRRVPNWMVWIWIPPAVLFLITSVLAFRNGIEAAAFPGVSGFFCVLMTRYTFEIQQVYDLVSRLESENARLRGRADGASG